MSAFIHKFIHKVIHLFKIFFQNVVIINVVNSPELFVKNIFEITIIRITINFINNFPSNITLNIIMF